MIYSGRIFPGVAISGNDLSGLTPEAALLQIRGMAAFPNEGKLLLTDGEKKWLVTPAQLGYSFDAQASVSDAYQIGRTGGLFTSIGQRLQARFTGINLSMQIINDQKLAQDYLLQVADQMYQPVQEASIQIRGVDVTVVRGQTGRSLDIPATMALVQNQLLTGQDAILEVVVSETPPSVLDLSPQADRVKSILSAPLVILMPEGLSSDLGPWAISPEDLAQMLTFSRITSVNQTNISLQVNQNLLRAYLQNLQSVIDRDAVNARFIFNDDTHQLDLIDHAQTGRHLDLEQSVTDISQKILRGDHQVTLAVQEAQPQVPDTATAAAMGITELVHQEVSYFYGSDSARVNNIRTAAGQFHGLLIAPGAIVSMADILGDVSLDSGYAEALIILGSETIQGVGGGVCQVSTTLFRAAFFTGFPILERHAHAYRVGYYEQTYSGASNPELAGLDATVFVPVVDMRFQNDTPYWLLMETYVSDTSLIWKFYSTSDGRTVEWHTSGPTNIVNAPDPKYEENSDLSEGAIKQIDYSADGADISVDRTVYNKDGAVYLQDNFTTHYLPWQAVYQYGPGTKIPKKYRNPG